MADNGDLQRVLLLSGVVPSDVAASWYVLPPPPTPPPEGLARATLEALLNEPLIAYLAAVEGPCEVAETAFPQLCTVLNALDAVLSRAGTDGISERICQRLDDIATKAFPPRTSPMILAPSSSAVAARRIDVLRLLLLILVRCAGVERLTSRELLSLAAGDLAIAVAVATATMREPATPAVPHLQVRLCQVLYELSTPQVSAEMATHPEEDSGNTPIEERLRMHIAHSHRLALCLVQFKVINSACVCAEDAQQRGAILVHTLRLIHNLTASQHLSSSGRVIARHLAVLWPRFGFRFLAPHLRRLLTTAEGCSRAAHQAQRELRRDLRTLGWVLHHCHELRQYARPLCAELAMKAAKGNHTPETLAVAVGAAANSGALEDRGPLYHALDSVDIGRKAAVCEKFPVESNRLWVIGEAWQVVEDLGFWPACSAGASGDPDAHDQAMAAQAAAADLAAIARLTGSLDFEFFDDPECDAWDSYADWDDHDDEWAEWPDLDDTAGNGEAPWELQHLEASGPLGFLCVPPPPPPPQRATGQASIRQEVTTLLCLAPEAFRCNFDGSLCLRPVRTPEGVLYDKESILAWLSWNKVCPVTGTALGTEALVEDADMGQGISAWLAASGEASVMASYQ